MNKRGRLIQDSKKTKVLSNEETIKSEILIVVHTKITILTIFTRLLKFGYLTWL